MKLLFLFALLATGCSLVDTVQVNAYQDISATGDGFPYNGNGAATSGKILSFGVAADSSASSAYLSITGKLAETTDGKQYSAEWELYGPSGDALPADAYQGGVLPNKSNANASEPLFAATLAPDVAVGSYRVTVKFLVGGEDTGTTLSRSFELLPRPTLPAELKMDVAFGCNSATEEPPAETASRTSSEAVDLSAPTASILIPLSESLCPSSSKSFSLATFQFQNLPEWVSQVSYNLGASDSTIVKPYYRSGDKMEPVISSFQELPLTRAGDKPGDATLGGLVLTKTRLIWPEMKASLQLFDVYGQELPLDLKVVVHL